ncbi:Cro/CI family transcriptional regulator [Pseudomonas sp. PvP001]|uniref:Cro/CI family transcriptional regulator n=1 Tax=Pseudomonas sp. PvP001 TaxID=3158559 RepID=UPI0033982921
MQRIPLAEYASRRHAQTARRLNMSQGSLSKAIREGRSIFVIEQEDGVISAVEEKPFPGQRRQPVIGNETNNSPSGLEGSGPNVPVHPSSEVQAR